MLSDYSNKKSTGRSVNFYEPPYGVLEYKLLDDCTESEAIVYTVIKSFAQQNKYYSGSIRQLATYSRKSMRQVYRILDALVAKEKITRVRGYDARGRWGVKIYHYYDPDIITDHC